MNFKIHLSIFEKNGTNQIIILEEKTKTIKKRVLARKKSKNIVKGRIVVLKK